MLVKGNHSKTLPTATLLPDGTTIYNREQTDYAMCLSYKSSNNDFITCYLIMLDGTECDVPEAQSYPLATPMARRTATATACCFGPAFLATALCWQPRATCLATACKSSQPRNCLNPRNHASRVHCGPNLATAASWQPRNCKQLLAATEQLLAPPATTVLATAPNQCKSPSRRSTNSRRPRSPRRRTSSLRKEEASPDIAGHEGTSSMSMSPN